MHFKVYFQALRYNMCIYRIKIRPFMLIHSLFKGISNFELALRFASSLVIQEGSTSLTNSLYSPPSSKSTGEEHQEERRAIRTSRSPTSWYSEMWQPWRDDMNSNQAIIGCKKHLTKGTLKISQGFIFLGVLEKKNKRCLWGVIFQSFNSKVRDLLSLSYFEICGDPHTATHTLFLGPKAHDLKWGIMQV